MFAFAIKHVYAILILICKKCIFVAGNRIVFLYISFNTSNKLR